MVDWFNLYQQPALFILALLVIAVWELTWKGLALWHSAKNRQKAWFVAVLILNTLGLLPIIYLLWFKPKEKVAGSGTVIKISSAKKAVKPSRKANKRSKS